MGAWGTLTCSAVQYQNADQLDERLRVLENRPASPAIARPLQPSTKQNDPAMEQGDRFERVTRSRAQRHADDAENMVRFATCLRCNM